MQHNRHLSLRPKYRWRSFDVRGLRDDVFLKYIALRDAHGVDNNEALNSIMKQVMLRRPMLKVRQRGEKITQRAESVIMGRRVREGLYLNFKAYCAARDLGTPARVVEAAILWHIAEEIPLEICGTADDVSRPLA